MEFSPNFKIMKIAISKPEIITIVIFGALLSALLWDNTKLRSELSDIHTIERDLAQYTYTAAECQQKGIEWDRKGNPCSILYTLFAAHKGNADAQYELGYYDLPKAFGRDAKRDEQWLIAAAQQGAVKHQNYLAAWYHNLGARGDAELGRKSFYWYKEAAMNNDPESMMMLGNYYRVGVGCDINYAEAEYWLKKGMNHPDAHWTTTDSCRCELAEVYAQTGRREEAYDLLRTAIAQGDKRAVEVLSYLKEEEAGQKGTPQSNPPSQP